MVATVDGQWSGAPWREIFESGASREMQYINLHTATLDSPQFLGSESVDRATWISLLRYCAGQENGGKIEDCADWTDRNWQLLTRVTSAEVKRDCALWKWIGKTLIVWSYPSENESRAKTLRARGKAAIEKRWSDEKSKKAKKGNPYANGVNGRAPLIHKNSPRLDPKRGAKDEIPD